MQRADQWLTGFQKHRYGHALWHNKRSPSAHAYFLCLCPIGSPALGLLEKISASGARSLKDNTDEMAEVYKLPSQNLNLMTYCNISSQIFLSSNPVWWFNNNNNHISVMFHFLHQGRVKNLKFHLLKFGADSQIIKKNYRSQFMT